MLGGYLEFFMRPAVADLYLCLRKELDDLIHDKVSQLQRYSLSTLAKLIILFRIAASESEGGRERLRRAHICGAGSDIGRPVGRKVCVGPQQPGGRGSDHSDAAKSDGVDLEIRKRARWRQLEKSTPDGAGSGGAPDPDLQDEAARDQPVCVDRGVQRSGKNGPALRQQEERRERRRRRGSPVAHGRDPHREQLHQPHVRRAQEKQEKPLKHGKSWEYIFFG